MKEKKGDKSKSTRNITLILPTFLFSQQFGLVFALLSLLKAGKVPVMHVSQMFGGLQSQLLWKRKMLGKGLLKASTFANE